MEQNRPPQFKARLIKAVYALCMTVFCLICAIILFIKGILIAGAILLLALFFAFITLRVLTKPYILFSEKGITIRRGILFQPKHLEFTDIEIIERIEPNHFIHISMKSGEDIEFSLSTLRKEDRIRFIFLIESDVNRLKISKQQS